MRAQAHRIEKLVRNGKGDAKSWTAELFGHRFEGRRPPPGIEPRASRLRVGEAALDASQPQQRTRVAIDRFTQGTVATALFEEQTESGGCASVRLELRDPRTGELGLVLLVLKDLLDGTLPVGGTSSVGRGVLTGAATITFHDDPTKPSRTAALEPGGPPSGDAASEIDEEIRRFHDAPPLSDDQRVAATATASGGPA
jgi:hypothetical protein